MSEARPKREVVGLRSDGCCRVPTSVFQLCCTSLSDTSNIERPAALGTAEAVTALRTLDRYHLDHLVLCCFCTAQEQNRGEVGTWKRLWNSLLLQTYENAELAHFLFHG